MEVSCQTTLQRMPLEKSNCSTTRYLQSTTTRYLQSSGRSSADIQLFYHKRNMKLPISLVLSLGSGINPPKPVGNATSGDVWTLLRRLQEIVSTQCRNNLLARLAIHMSTLGTSILASQNYYVYSKEWWVQFWHWACVLQCASSHLQDLKISACHWLLGTAKKICYIPLPRACQGQCPWHAQTSCCMLNHYVLSQIVCIAMQCQSCDNCLTEYFFFF